MEKQDTIRQNTEPSSNQCNNKSSKVLVLLFALFLIASGIAGYVVYQNYQLKEQITQLESRTPRISPIPSQPSPLTEAEETFNEPTPSLSPGFTENWKTLKNEVFSFRYPTDWFIEINDSDYFGGKTAVIKNPQKSVTLTLYPATNNYFPYGLGDAEIEKAVITINFLGENYQLEEKIADQESAYIDLVRKNKYSFMLGTGYPAGSQSAASLENYNQQKDTFLQIISSFEINN